MLSQPSLTNSSSWAPLGETNLEVLSDSIDLISIVLSGIAYGAVLPLYCICAYELWIQYRKGERKKKPLLHLGYISIFLILLTMYLAGITWQAQLAYVNERNYPLGPALYADLLFKLPVSIMSLFAFFAINWLTDIILIWRLYVVYSGYNMSQSAARAIIILPTLMLLGSISLSLITIYASVHGGQSFWSKTVTKFVQVGYYALSLFTTIYSTVFLLIRLIKAWRRGRETGRSALQGQYLTIAAILVESSALYSVWNIIYLGLYVVNSPFKSVFLGTLSAVQVIALLLIIYRVTRGKAWDSNTLSTTSNMEFKATESVRNTSIHSQGTVISVSTHSRETVA